MAHGAPGTRAGRHAGEQPQGAAGSARTWASTRWCSPPTARPGRAASQRPRAAGAGAMPATGCRRSGGAEEGAGGHAADAHAFGVRARPWLASSPTSPKPIAALTANEVAAGSGAGDRAGRGGALAAPRAAGLRGAGTRRCRRVSSSALAEELESRITVRAAAGPGRSAAADRGPGGAARLRARPPRW